MFHRTKALFHTIARHILTSVINKLIALMVAPVKFEKAVLPPLDYDFHELEPVLSREIIEVHYKKHHQTYINNYNDSIEKFTKALENGNVKEATQLCSAIKFNGGSHINHSIYWKNLAPVSKGGGKFPSKESPLTTAVEAKFGSYEGLIEKFNAIAASIQVFLKIIQNSDLG